MAFPRTRGGDPYEGGLVAQFPGFSPHPRG